MDYGRTLWDEHSERRPEMVHVLNRGNARARIFNNDADYEAFETDSQRGPRVLRQAGPESGFIICPVKSSIPALWRT